MAKPRTVIADDHRLFVAGLEKLLAADCHIVASVYDGKSLVEAVARLQPEIVVQDLSMPDIKGIDLVHEVRRIDPVVKIIVVTMCDDADVAAEVFRAGASAYVLKNCAVPELLSAVRLVMDDKTYVTPLIAGGMIQSLTKPVSQGDSGRQLTFRQREVLSLLAQGKSMKEAAATLNLAVRTVAFHKYRMMAQMHIRTSAELIRFAVNQGIV